VCCRESGGRQQISRSPHCDLAGAIEFLLLVSGLFFELHRKRDEDFFFWSEHRSVCYPAEQNAPGSYKPKPYRFIPMAAWFTGRWTGIFTIIRDAAIDPKN